jgi:hypothetical protein
MSQEENLCKSAEILFCRHEHVTAKSNDGGAYGDHSEDGIISRISLQTFIYVLVSYFEPANLNICVLIYLI